MTTKLKIVWVFLAMIILCRTLYLHHVDPSPEASLNGVITMATLSFPSGFLVVLLLNFFTMIVSNVFSITLPDNYLTVAISWFLLFCAGYYQWFVIVPTLFAKFKKKSSPKSEERGRERGK